MQHPEIVSHLMPCPQVPSARKVFPILVTAVTQGRRLHDDRPANHQARPRRHRHQRKVQAHPQYTMLGRNIVALLMILFLWKALS